MTAAQAAGTRRRDGPLPASGQPHLWLVAGVIGLYWLLSIHQIERTPRVNEGEALIASLGYKLATQGVYGTDLFAGFHGMERHYFLITPLMSLLQAVNMQLLGLSIFSLRVLPALAGAVACALTYAVGRRVVSKPTAVLAVLLLMGWQWARAGATLMAVTGIPLMDVARIVRHDILVAPLGLAAWWVFMKQRRTQQARYAVLGGLLTGLAGLGHVYGLFWLATFFLLLLLERWWAHGAATMRTAAWLTLGTAIVWLPVAAFVLPHPADFAAQAIQSRSRFELLSPAFYVTNALTEIHRYSLGWRETGGWLHPGAWVLLLGLPAAAIALARRAYSRRDPRALRLLVPAVTFPTLFALLIEPKTYNYLIAVAPIWALLLAWGASWLWRAAPRAGRRLVAAGLAVILIQGGVSIAQSQVRAAQVRRPAETFAELRVLIPPGARVLGHQHYWPGLYDREFRSFGLPFFLAGADMTPTPVTFREALEQVGAEYVLLDPVMQAVFAAPLEAEAAANAEQFWDFMDDHDARLLTTLPGGAEGPVQVYQLTW